jgi:hypothetical protein
MKDFINRLSETVAIPFEPITLRRQMMLYRSFLEFTPEIPASPNAELIYRLLSGEKSYKAHVRSKIGESNLKNFENFIRGKNRLSRVTINRLADSFGVESKSLNLFLNKDESTPLFAIVFKLFGILEAIPLKAYSYVNSTEVLCPCCKNNMMDDMKVWWGKNGIDIGMPEKGFVERILNAVFGSFLILSLIKAFISQNSRSTDWFIELAKPNRHPTGNWLNEVMQRLGCSSLTELENELALRGVANGEITVRRLRDWSAGRDMMPVKDAIMIIDSIPDNRELKIQLIVSRTYGFLTDFICASREDNSYDRISSQKLIYDRMRVLTGKLRLLQKHNANKVPSVSSSIAQ